MRSSRPLQTGAAARIGAADAVVVDLDDRVAVDPGDADPRGGRVRVLADVGERLRDDVERCRLDRSRQPFVGHRRELDGQRRARGQALDRRAEAAVGEHRRMDAAGELAQLCERERELVARGGQDVACALRGRRRAWPARAAAPARARRAAAARRRGGSARAGGARRPAPRRGGRARRGSRAGCARAR